jgi:DNA polymerase elongation subunit (family B)
VELITCYWTTVGGELALRLKTSDGRWRLISPSIRPYFFTLAEYSHKAPQNARVINGEFYRTDWRRCVKVEVDKPSDCVRAREYFPWTGEADLSFHIRWCIDLSAPFSTSPRILFYDVEASTKQGFPNPRNPVERILCIGGVDEKGREYFICHDDEREIFREFNELLKNYDLVVGFNSGFDLRRILRAIEGEGNRKGKKSLGWDLPYLVARARAMGYDFDFRQVEWGDWMHMYKVVNSIQRPGSLDDLYQKHLGKTLHKPAMRGQSIEEWFEKDREALREYNLGDCWAVKELNDELRLVEVFCEISNLAHIPYSDAQSPMRIVDALVLGESSHSTPRIVFPSKFEVRPEEEEEGYAGAEVVKYHAGFVFEDLTEVDIKGTYPHTIVTFNIGHEVVGEGIRTEKLSFRRDIRSVLARAIEKVIRARAEAKRLYAETKHPSYKIKDLAFKVAGNSFYGVIGSPYSRYFDTDIAESITLTVRKINQIVREICEFYNRKVFYGDTDSAHLAGNINIDQLNAELKRRIMERYGVPEEFYCIEVEKKGSYIGAYYPPLAKKRYVLFTEDGWIVKGFEVVRKNTPKIVCEAQKHIIDIMAEYVKAVRRGQPFDFYERVAEYRKKLKRDIFEGRVEQLLVIETGTREDLDEYEVSNLPQVKAALKAIGRGFKPGGSITYVVTDIGNGLETEPVFPGEPIPKISERARQYYWERVESAIENLLGRLGEVAENQTLEKWLGLG